MQFRNTCLLLLALPAGFSTPALAQQIAFRPNVGDQWSTQVTSELHTDWKDLEVRIDGELAPDQGWKVEVQARKELAFDDAVVAWDREGARVFERDYRQVSLDVVAPFEMLADEQRLQSEAKAYAEGALLGQRVRFENSAATQGWRRFLVDQIEEGQQASPIPNLTVDMDFQCLMPPSGIKVGQSWEVDPMAVLQALNAHHGMEMHQERSGGGELPMWFGPLTNQPELHTLFQELDRDRVRATAKLMPKRRVGQARVYPIEFQLQVTGEVELTDWAMDSLLEAETGDTEFAVEYASQNTTLSGSGMLLWNLDWRRTQSVVFRGSASFSRTQSVQMTSGDQATQIEVDCDGEIRIHVTQRSDSN